MADGRFSLTRRTKRKDEHEPVRDDRARDPKPEYIKHTVIRGIAGAVWGNCNRHPHSQACALGRTLFRQIDFGHGEGSHNGRSPEGETPRGRCLFRCSTNCECSTQIRERRE